MFGKTGERRQERRVIEEYSRQIDEICTGLTPLNHAAAVALASVPDEIRGFGRVKEDSFSETRLLRAKRVQRFRDSPVAR